ncbi:MAG: radical SAM protein [Nanoarchaeota archaeon]|nr:radical SAM protein [Nanoarchaeota archaeon]
MIAQRYGGLKIVLHPKKLKALKEGKIIAPIYIRFKPTNICNHRCSFCSYDPETGDTDVRSLLNRTSEIPREKILEILKDFKEMGVKAITFSGGGEPLIYPYIEEAMKKTLEYGIGLSIITNGQALEGEKAKILSQANWVRISANSCDSKTFSLIRKRPESWFYELEKNIREFAKIKRQGCEFGINFVVQLENASQVYDSVKYFRDLGVNHIKITPMWNQDFKKYHEPIKETVLEQIERAKRDFHSDKFAVHDTYAGDFSGASVPQRCYQKCYIMQTVPVIGADCNVYFCHDKAYSETGILGSIKDKSFKELWFSPEAAGKFKNFNPEENCKHHCTNDAKNLHIKGIINREPGYEILHDALDCYGDDIDFI